MEKNIPKIDSVDKLTVLYESFNSVEDMFVPEGRANVDSLYRIHSDNGIKISQENFDKIKSLLSNSKPYLSIADSLYSMRKDLYDFNNAMQENVEHIIQRIRGKFEGESIESIQTEGTVLGIIPTSSVGVAKGEINGQVKAEVLDYKTLINAVPATKIWLQNIVRQYIIEINNALEEVNDKIENIPSRLEIKVNRINDAVKDTLNQENVTQLKFVAQNILYAIKGLREDLYPVLPPLAPGCSGAWNYTRVMIKKDNFALNTKTYVDSLKQLKVGAIVDVKLYPPSSYQLGK